MEEDKKTRREHIYKNIMIVTITMFITFVVTSFALYKFLPDSIGAGVSYNDMSISAYLEKIKKAIQKYYLWPDKIDEENLKAGAIEGFVKGLGDEYTEYIPPKDIEEYTEEITGTFVGIGIYMIADEETNSIVVYYPIPDTPAEKAGLKAGDKIKKVDGVEYTAEDFDKISDYIKGKDGTKVNIVIERDGKEKSFNIERKKVITDPITTKKLTKDIGYLKLPSFDEGTAEAFKGKVNKLLNDKIKSLIIDLRNDGGGIVDEAIDIADYILDKEKVIVSTVNNTGEKETTFSKNDPIFNIPIVILVNENTASASEILIAALQENNKATIVGTKTYGKGIIQTFFTLADGSGLKITTAEYYTPKDNTIHKIGITPDEVVELPKDIDNIYAINEKDDTQLQKAVELLK